MELGGPNQYKQLCAKQGVKNDKLRVLKWIGLHELLGNGPSRNPP